MKFSVFTVSLPEWTVEAAISELAAQGWDGIEWRVVDEKPSSAPGFWSGNLATIPLTGVGEALPEAARRTRAVGLGLSGVGSYVQCGSHDDVERILAATAAAGIGQVRISVPKLGIIPYPELLEQTREHYAWVAGRAAHHGVKALVELHHATVTSSASSALRVIDGLDPDTVGVIHDLGNLLIEGFEDLTAAFQMLGPYLAHVHVKNGGWRRTSGTGAPTRWDFDWMPMREGQGDVAGYLEKLRRWGYDGWVTVEDFSTDRPLAERTADNLEFLRAIDRRLTRELGR